MDSKEQEYTRLIKKHKDTLHVDVSDMLTMDDDIFVAHKTTHVM